MKAHGVTLAAVLLVPVWLAPMTIVLGAEASSGQSTTSSDCEIFAQIMKTRGIPHVLSANSAGAGCDWSGTGMMIRVEMPSNEWASTFSRPVYSADGRNATVDFAEIYISDAQRGSHAYSCALEIQNGHWQISACKAGVIAD